MKRLTLLLLAMALIGFVLFQFSLRENEPAEELSENRVPQGDSLPFDTTVERKVIEEEEAGEEGTEAREELPNSVLPASRPREIEVSAKTESALPFDTTVGRKVIEENAREDGTVVLKELPNSVLPAPPEREIEVSAETESGRTLDSMALDSWKRGDLVRALELFDEAVKADPDDALIRTNYGRMLTKTGAYEKASPHLLRAAELEPDDPTVWLDLQTLYERQFLVEQADDAASRAEALAGGRRIVQDEYGIWMFEGDSTIP